ncbi:MAG: hypothetical protein HYW57_06645 [Ignavibacteriales bacterium]|nr:hypothetical protein [Ignavibacteriales bacterium]
MMVRTAFLLILVPSLLSSQGSSSGLGFLQLPLVARNAALGGSTIADNSHFSSSLINPSLLVGSGSIELLVAHQEWIQDVQSEFFAARVPLQSATLSLTVATTAIRGIEIREVPGPAEGSFTSRSAVFGAIAAFELSREMSAGLTVKYLYEKIFVDEASGMGLDLGLTAALPFDGMRAGLSLLNLGSVEKFRDKSASLPSVVNGGIAHLIESGDFRLRSTGALSYELHRATTHLHLGVEGTYRSSISLRLGFLSGFESRGVSGGLGLHSGIFLVDYAFVPFALGLGSAHLAAVGLRF